ncbi:hypothetical protein NMG60_11000513 [Bertholletia excelsa]
MEDKCSLWVLEAMDRLWFYQIILPLAPTSPLIKVVEPNSEETFQTPVLEHEASSSLSTITINSEDETYNEAKQEERLEEVNPNRITVNSKSQSSSHLNRSQHTRKRRSQSGRLVKTMSCKSLMELELEEVKGFMDLGFKFTKEHVTPRMMSVLPGLERLGFCDDEVSGNVVEEVKHEKKRPYLSEAWLVRTPTSPLLNLRLPRGSAASEMKRHLRYWAKTVASVIQKES